MRPIKYTIDDIKLFGKMIDNALFEKRNKEALSTGDVKPYYSEVDNLEELFEVYKNEEYVETVFIKYLNDYSAAWALLVPYDEIPLYITNLDNDTYPYMALKWRMHLGK